MVPITGLDTYQRLRELNRWTDTFLPNAAGPPRQFPSSSRVRRQPRAARRGGAAHALRPAPRRLGDVAQIEKARRPRQRPQGGSLRPRLVQGPLRRPRPADPRRASASAGSPCEERLTMKHRDRRPARPVVLPALRPQAVGGDAALPAARRRCTPQLPARPRLRRSRCSTRCSASPRPSGTRRSTAPRRASPSSTRTTSTTSRRCACCACARQPSA